MSMALHTRYRRQAGEAAHRGAGLLRSILQRNGHRRNSQFRLPCDEEGHTAGSEAGQSMVEMAVTLPVLFALLFCFMEVCVAFYTFSMISESAREGTRYAMVRGATCKASSGASCEATAAEVDTYVEGLGWPNIAGGTMSVCTYYDNNACNTNPSGSEAKGDPVKVTVTYVMPITMPFVPNHSITMTSSSQMNIIQ